MLCQLLGNGESSCCSALTETSTNHRALPFLLFTVPRRWRAGWEGLRKISYPTFLPIPRTRKQNKKSAANLLPVRLDAVQQLKTAVQQYSSNRRIGAVSSLIPHLSSRFLSLSSLISPSEPSERDGKRERDESSALVKDLNQHFNATPTWQSISLYKSVQQASCALCTAVFHESVRHHLRRKVTIWQTKATATRQRKPSLHNQKHDGCPSKDSAHFGCGV